MSKELIEDKRNKYRILVIELYRYVPYCKHTIKAYKEMIYTYFIDRKTALDFIDRNIVC